MIIQIILIIEIILIIKIILTIEFVLIIEIILIIQIILIRPLITASRRLGLHRVLPLDLHVEYHKAAGIIVLILRWKYI